MSGPQPGHDPEAERRPDEPRIYVASLSDYNAGVLHGAWLEAVDSVEGLEEGIAAMLRQSPTMRRYGDLAEEWAIHDYDNFGSIRLGEYESLERVTRLAEGLREHGEAFGAWISLRDDSEVPSPEDFVDHFHGEFSSAEAYGEQLLYELGFDVADVPGVPESLRAYVAIDGAGWVRDMELNGEISTVESQGGVYVFWL
jgi:antirestriction protein